MVREIDLEQVAQNLEAAVNDIEQHHTQLVVIHGGKRVMAMIPIEVYERWFADREKAFQFYDEVLSQSVGYSDEEVHEDIDHAIREVRSKRTTQ